MSILQTTTQAIDDRINPVMVKELRQAVQSRFVAIVLMLFLLIEFVAVLLMILFAPNLASNFTAGRDLFLLLQSILIGTCLIFIAGYVGVRLTAERADQNVDLVFITTIKPRAIVSGKIISGLALTLLIYSACAPFMVMTYLLRGIDIPTIAIILGMDLLIIFLADCAAIFIAAMPVRLATKILLGILLLIGLVFGFAFSLEAAGAMIYTGVASRFDSWDFWAGVIATVSLTTTFCGLLYFLAGAMLTPPAADRARPVRIYFTLAWLATGIIFYCMSLYPGTTDTFIGWGYTIMPLLVASLIVGGSERDRWGVRLQSAIPRNPGVRGLWFLFSSGALGGLVWAGMLIAITLLSLWQLQSTPALPGVRGTGMIEGEAALACYVLAYVLTAVFIRQVVLHRKVKTTVVGAIAMLLMAGGSIIPMLIAFFSDPNGWDRDATRWMWLNPVAGFSASSKADRLHYLYISSGWCAVMLLFAAPWAIDQLRRCVPLARAAAHEIEHTPKPVAVATSLAAEVENE